MTARSYDINGWPEIKGNPISKVGVFPYLGKSIGAPDPEGVYMVYRPEEELNDPEAIESFKLIPWVDDHTMLGAIEDGLTTPEQKGVAGVTGEDVYFDSPYLYSNLKLFSDSQADLVESGKKELSLGYRCEYEKKAGNFDGETYDYIQRSIRGNHIASVDEGRMGPEVAVLDQKDIMLNDENSFFTIDSKDLIMKTKKKAAKAVDSKEVLAAGQLALDEVMKEAKDMEGMEPMMGMMTKMMPAMMMAMMEAMKPAADEEYEEEGMDEEGEGEGEDNIEEDGKDEGNGQDSAELKSVRADLKVAQDSIASLQKDGIKGVLKEVAQRDAIAAQASAHIGAFDHSEMTCLDVCKYAADKLELDCEEGQEIHAVKAALKVMGSTPNPSVAFGADEKLVASKAAGESIINDYANSVQA